MEGRDARTHEIIGAAMEVHRHLGRGFLESVYQEALAVELEMRGVAFDREVDLLVQYKGRELPCSFRADLVCCGEIIVELKAILQLTTREHSQIINYLRATRLHTGLLINFGASSLEYKRFIDSSHPT
jgi:GxxExxY protein